MCDIMLRFWTYVDKSTDDVCWPWLGAKLDAGYGLFNYRNKTALAHRLAYEFTHGEGSAKGFKIRHSCDNPSCCNPKHLIKGSQQDNMNDKIARGRDRNLKGNECSWRKLNEEDIPKIRILLKQGIFHRVIAEKFGVNVVTISDIKQKRTWRHV